MIARALIVKDKKILLIHRHKFGNEFFTLPGGHLEPGESAEEALVREVEEETSIKVSAPKHLWLLIDPFNDQKNEFFLVDEFSGQANECNELCSKDPANQYGLEWHPLADIPSLRILPEKLKSLMIGEFTSHMPIEQ